MIQLAEHRKNGDKLKGYKTSKGAVQFPLSEPLPIELIREIVCFRLAEQG